MERGIVKVEQNALILPDIDTLRKELKAVRQFQAAVKELLIEGSDWGVIPGTTKPTLLKPGAEKIDKILKLADTYDTIDKIEDWDKPLFFYEIKCRLTLIGTDIVISEGMGSCSSMEGKYRYRWVAERDVPQGIDKSTLPHQERKGKAGGHWTVYQIENDDIYTLANTILKMAKKRAHIDASLSAGRLSDVFTQDIEDMTPDYVVSEAVKDEPEPTKSSEHWCELHNQNFFKKGRMKNYAHPLEGGGWCNEGDVDQGKTRAQTDAEVEANPAPQPLQSTRSEVADTGNGNLPVEGIEEAPPKDSVDQVWLDETLGAIRWKVETAKSWIKAQFKVPVEGTLMEVLNSLPEKQRKQFVEHIRLMRESSVAK